MAAETFAFANRSVLVHEGGKVNHPKDPGGRTNQGITQRVYDGYRRRKGLPQRDVYLMDAAERDAIYHAQYWDAIRGDSLPAGVDYVVYDGAVNSGPVQSVKWLQRALAEAGLYSGAIDGHIGEGTLAAIEQHGDLDQLVRAICERRMVYLKALKTWRDFGKGWSRRVMQVQRAGWNLATGSVPAEAKFVEGGNRKAVITDAKTAPNTAAPDLSAGTGVSATTLTQATDALAPLTDKSDKIAVLFAILTGIGVLLTIGGVLWGLYARRARAQRDDALDLAQSARVANDNAPLEDEADEREAA